MSEGNREDVEMSGDGDDETTHDSEGSPQSVRSVSSVTSDRRDEDYDSQSTEKFEEDDEEDVNSSGSSPPLQVIEDDDDDVAPASDSERGNEAVRWSYRESGEEAGVSPTPEEVEEDEEDVVETMEEDEPSEQTEGEASSPLAPQHEKQYVEEGKEISPSKEEQSSPEKKEQVYPGREEVSPGKDEQKSPAKEMDKDVQRSPDKEDPGSRQEDERPAGQENYPKSPQRDDQSPIKDAEKKSTTEMSPTLKEMSPVSKEISPTQQDQEALSPSQQIQQTSSPIAPQHIVEEVTTKEQEPSASQETDNAALQIVDVISEALPEPVHETASSFVPVPEQEQRFEPLLSLPYTKNPDLNTCLRERDEARLTAEALCRQLKQREDELQRVIAENTTLSSQLTKAINEKCEAILQAQNTASKEIQLYHKEKSLGQQMELLHGHNKQLTTQLTKQGLELAEVRRSSESRILHLERQLALTKQELRSTEDSETRISERLAEESRRVEALIDKIREAKDSEIGIQEIHKQQLQAQTRLAQLYQEEGEEARSLVEQLSTVVSELQAALNNASERYGELETNSARGIAQLQATLENKETAICALQQELKNANILIEQSNEECLESQVAAMSPAAAVARKLVRSGLTLTQVYAQYAATTEQLDAKKVECEQLEDALATIVKQIEKNAPQLSADKETLERIQQENDRLIHEHDIVVRQCNEIKCEAQEQHKKGCQLERDNARLQSVIDDLRKQIIVLLREVESYKHRTPPPPLRLSNSLDGRSADEVLTERLLPFRDMDELQTRNMELMAVVRNLSRRAEAEELAHAEGKDLMGLTSKLEEAMQQLSDLKDRETQNANFREQLLQQRDYYRELALQGSSSKQAQDVALSPVKFDPNTPIKRKLLAEDQELRAKLKTAEDTLAASEQQVEKLKKDMMIRAGELAQQIEKLKEEVNTAKLDKAKLLVVCEHKDSKLTTALSKAEDLQKKLDSESARAKTKNEECEKYLKMVSEMQQELGSLHAVYSETKTSLTNAEAELERYRYIEMTLHQQIQALERSVSDRVSIVASIEEMKASFERSNAESHTILIRQLDEAQLENRGLTKRLEEEGARLGGELAQLHKALETERAAVEAAHAETEKAKGEAARVAERLAQAERDVSALRAHRNPNVETAVQTEVCVSEEVLREKRTAQRAVELEQQVTHLRSELQKSEMRYATMNSIIEASEEALKRAKLEAQSAQVDAANRLMHLQEQLNASHTKLEELQTQLADANKRTEVLNAQGTETITAMRTELEELRKRAEQGQALEETCQALQTALEAAENESRTTNEALAREMMKLAENTKLYSSLECQLATEQEMRKKISEELEQSKQMLKDVEVRGSEKEIELSNAAAALEQEAGTLQKQNSALLDQVQLLGAELCALRQHQQQQQSSTAEPTQQTDSSSSFSGDEPATIEQLLQVLRYVRTERNAAISNAEALSRQKAELQAQLETVQSQLQTALSQASELEPGASVAATRAQFEELMRRVEVTSVLTESSSRQREAATSLRRENEELRAQTTALLKQQETNVAELHKIREQMEALRVELTSANCEAERWRKCAHNLKDRSNRPSPSQLKQQMEEADKLNRQLSSTAEELRKTRATLMERETELARDRAELKRLQGEIIRHRNESQEQIKKLQEEISSGSNKLAAKTAQCEEMTNKEMQIRRIAKKYKMQYEEATKKLEEEKAAKQAGETAQAKDERIAEIEAKAAAAETRANEVSGQLSQLETKVTELQQQVDAKDQQLETLSKENTIALQKSERAKQVLNAARLKISQSNAENTTLKNEIATIKQALSEAQSKLRNSEQTREEESARKAALTTQYEGKIARLERELNDAHQQSTHPQIRQEKQVSKTVASATEKGNNDQPPTANIRPMAGPSQTKTQQIQQSATVPPTSRGTPTARLRPMSMARSVAVLAPSQQQQQQQQTAASSSGVSVAPVQGVQVASSEPSTSRQPAVSVAPMMTATPTSEASTSQGEISEESTSQQSTSGATVVLVRPQEVQPAVSSSQNLQSTSFAPPTSSQSRPPPPTLKRQRDDSVPQVEAPQLKQGRMEVTSASVVEAEEEPSSSLHGAPDEVIIVDSGEDTEEEVEKGDDDVDPEDVEPDYGDDEDDDVEEEYSVRDELMEDDAFETDDIEQSDAGDEGDNEVVVLDEPVQLSEEIASMIGAGTSEPSSSSAPGQASNQAQLSLPQQQALEETGDDGIVPSTPTVVHRREGLNSLQVPQTLNQHFTFSATESRQSSLSPSHVSASVDEPMDDSSGRSVPQQLSPQEGSEVPTELEEDAGRETESADLPSSSDGVPAILVTPVQEEAKPAATQHSEVENKQPIPTVVDTGVPRIPARGISPRGLNRARRSGTRSRPTSRPTPIVWDQDHQHPHQPPPHMGQGPPRGMPDSMRGVRGQQRRPRRPGASFTQYYRHF